MKSLVEDLNGVKRFGKWLKEFVRVNTEGKMAIAMGKGVEEMNNKVVEEEQTSQLHSGHNMQCGPYRNIWW